MKTYASKTGWLKIMALGSVALGLAACSGMGFEGDDVYVPTSYYDRHPIVVTKSNAYAANCGNWTKDLIETSQNVPYENLGCSQQNNIAAMVADKDDLWRLRKEAPADATRRSTLFNKYRQGEATAAAQEAQQKVAISNVGGGG